MPRLPTTEERDSFPLCGAKTRGTGKPCRKWAGERTSHKGVGKCYLHGGNTPTHKKNAALIKAREQGRAHPALSLQMTPGQLMTGIVHLTAGYVQYLVETVA